MRRFLRFSVLAVAAVCMSAVVVHAADWCFDYGPRSFVAQNFVKPGKGACKILVGHDIAGRPVSGTACLSSNGDTLRVGYTLYLGTVAEHGRLIIPNPTLTGGTSSFIQVSSTGNFDSFDSASAAICDPSNQPIP